MRRHFLIPAAVAALFLGGCSERNENPITKEQMAASPPADRGPKAETVVAVALETQARMNLETARLEATNFFPEVQGYGRVLSPAPLSSLVSDLVAAGAAAEASGKELKRLRTLAEQNNAAPRALEAVQAVATRDEASAATVRQKLLISWGTAIAGRKDLPAFVHSLAAGEAALVQITLPAGETLSSQPGNARLFPLGGESVKGDFIGPAPAVDPELQGEGFLFLATNAGSHLKPGAAVTARLERAARPTSAVEVPESAVVRYREKAWVYVQTDGTHFARRQIEPIHPLPGREGWFITEGLKPGDRIVVGGAASLLSEEQKSQFQLED